MIIRTTIAGSSEAFYYTALDEDGAPESIEDDEITFRASYGALEIIASTGNGRITKHTQSGATLGQCLIKILPTDYPTAWAGLAFGKNVAAQISVKRETPAGDVIKIQPGFWLIEGPGV